YSTGETHLAGMVLARAVGMPLADYLSREIWGPAGMERDGAWRLDRQGRELAGCCLAMTLADYARLGQFVLEGGRVQGRQIVDPAFLAQATRRQIDNGRPAPAGYGYLWWIGPRAFEASGIHGQSILIYPQDRLVIAINSHWARPDAPEDFAAQGALQAAIREAVRAP
ncbi:MAG: serine hydrolase, partial [Hyphomicrobiales bacterium]|nr:serine hydrolase [Hyphomicrobiales bacterium]